MKALISPIELVGKGYRVAQISQEAFEVADPLFWVDCADDLVTGHSYYDPIDQVIKDLYTTGE